MLVSTLSAVADEPMGLLMANDQTCAGHSLRQNDMPILPTPPTLGLIRHRRMKRSRTHGLDVHSSLKPSNEIEFQELIRTELILPHLANDFLQLFAEENAGGLLFAFLKANGELRPLVCGDTLRRRLAFIAQFFKLDAETISPPLTPISSNVLGACRMVPPSALNFCKH